MIRQPSTLPGHKGVPHAPIEDSAHYTKLADVETVYNSRNDGASMDVPLKPESSMRHDAKLDSIIDPDLEKETWCHVIQAAAG